MTATVTSSYGIATEDGNYITIQTRRVPRYEQYRDYKWLRGVQGGQRIEVTKTRSITQSKRRIYVYAAGETILGQFVNRRHRPFEVYRREVMPYVGKVLGLSGKYRWSSKAGCSCPCSPGFIEQEGNFLGCNRFDVFVTVRDLPVNTVGETVTEAQQSLAKYQQEQIEAGRLSPVEAVQQEQALASV